MTIKGEPVVVVAFPEVIGFPFGNRQIIVPKNHPTEVPARCIDDDGWYLRNGLRVCRVEMVEIRDAA